MFEAISFSTQDKSNAAKPLDIGALVECMLFYQKVIVIADRNILQQLIRFFGIDVFTELVEEEYLTVLYSHAYLAVATQTIRGYQYHDFAEITLQDSSFEQDIRKICTDFTGKTGKGRRKALRLEQKITKSVVHPIVLEGVRQAVLEPEYIECAARLVLQEFFSPCDFSRVFFKTNRGNNGFIVSTNIDELVNERGVSISAASVLAHVMDVEKELFFSSQHNSELASSPLSAKLGELKINQVIARSKQNTTIKNHFVDFIFDDAKALREAVNTNRIDLDELLNVLNKSKKFKNWIVNVPPDTDLIKSYYKEVTHKTIFDKLPGKTSRWLLFTGVGVTADMALAGGIGTTLGVGLAALDSFYLDKLLKGWKPNQFIEEDVRKLIFPPSHAKTEY